MRKNQGYSLFWHLGKLVSFGTYRDSMAIAAFSAYFDASGNKNDHKVLTVAGFVSTVRKWDRFDERWASILKGAEVSAMHMTDFASSAGEFRNWRGQSERRRKFVAALAQCTKRNSNKGFASTLVIPDYNDVNRKYMLSERVGQPYTLCAHACLGGLARWAAGKRLDFREVLIAMESGDQDQGELLRKAREEEFKVVPLSKADAQAFQAGDMAAWKVRTAVHNSLFGSTTGPGDNADILRSLGPINPILQRNGGFDRETLLRYCREKRIARRKP